MCPGFEIVHLRRLGGLALEVVVGKVASQATDKDDGVEADAHASAVVAAGSRSLGSGSGLGSRVTGLLK